MAYGTHDFIDDANAAFSWLVANHGYVRTFTHPNKRAGRVSCTLGRGSDGQLLNAS
jgi:hypothetical protein